MKKKTYVVIAIIIIFIMAIIIFQIYNVNKKDEIVDEVISESYLKEVAFDYLLYSSVEKVSVQYLINEGKLSESYSEFSCIIMDKDSNYYEDCNESNDIVESVDLVINVYSEGAVVEYLDVYNDSMTLKLELYGEEEENFIGIYDELGDEISNSKEINIDEITDGIYRYYYNNTFLEFYITKDNVSPILIDSYVNNNSITAIYDDESLYDVYVYYSLENVELSYELEYKFNDGYYQACNENSYYVFYYAKDAAGNFSEINVIENFLIECTDTSFNFEVSSED